MIYHLLPESRLYGLYIWLYVTPNWNRIRLTDIIYIEVDDKQITFHLENEVKHTVIMSLSNCERELGRHNFLWRADEKILVNIHKIEKYNDKCKNDARLAFGEKKFDVSRTGCKRLMAYLYINGHPLTEPELPFTY